MTMSNRGLFDRYLDSHIAAWRWSNQTPFRRLAKILLCPLWASVVVIEAVAVFVLTLALLMATILVEAAWNSTIKAFSWIAHGNIYALGNRLIFIWDEGGSSRTSAEEKTRKAWKELGWEVPTEF